MWVNILFSLILLFSGFLILVDKKFSWKEKDIDLSSYNLYILIGGSLILFGILWLYSSLKPSKNKPKSPPTHTICPKCKQTYNYSDLKNEKCPTCDIDTIEIEQYYKDNPPKEKR